MVWSWEMTFFTREDQTDVTRVQGDGDVHTGRTFAQRGYADMDVDAGIEYLDRACGWTRTTGRPARISDWHIIWRGCRTN